MTIRSILAAVNGFDRSLVCLKTGRALSARLNAPLSICTVAGQEETPGEATARLRPRLEGEGEEAMTCLQVPAYLDDDETGRAYALSEEATRAGADLILLGCHSRASRAGFEGTMTERLLRRCGVPILVAVTPRARPYDHVLIAVEPGSPPDALIANVRAVAPDARLTLLQVAEPSLGDRLAGTGNDPETLSQLETDLEAQAAAAGERDASVLVAPGRARTLIGEIARREGADLVVVATRGRSGIGRAVLGSTAASLIADPPADLLLVKSLAGGALSA